MNAIKYRHALVRHTAKRQAELKTASTPAPARSKVTVLFIIAFVLAALAVTAKAGTTLFTMLGAA